MTVGKLKHTELEAYRDHLPYFEKYTFAIWHISVGLDVIHPAFLLVLSEFFDRVPCIRHVPLPQLSYLLFLLRCDLWLFYCLWACFDFVIFVLIVRTTTVLPQIREFLHGLARLTDLSSILLDQLLHLFFFNQELKRFTMFVHEDSICSEIEFSFIHKLLLPFFKALNDFINDLYGIFRILNTHVLHEAHDCFPLRYISILWVTQIWVQTLDACQEWLHHNVSNMTIDNETTPSKAILMQLVSSGPHLTNWVVIWYFPTYLIQVEDVHGCSTATAIIHFFFTLFRNFSPRRWILLHVLVKHLLPLLFCFKHATYLTCTPTFKSMEYIIELFVWR